MTSSHVPNFMYAKTSSTDTLVPVNSTSVFKPCADLFTQPYYRFTV